MSTISQCYVSVISDVNHYTVILRVTPLHYVRDFTWIMQTKSYQINYEARVSHVLPNISIRLEL